MAEPELKLILVELGDELADLRQFINVERVEVHEEKALDRAAKRIADGDEFDALILDLDIPSQRHEGEIRRLHRRYPELEILVVSKGEDASLMRQALEDGVCAFLFRPLDQRQILQTVENLKHIVRQKSSLNEALRDLDRSDEANQTKRRFLANVGHEIRTPMNAIVGLTKLLLKQKPRADQTKYLQAINNSSDNLLVLINDLLDMSKIDAGKMTLELAPFEPREVLAIVIGIFQYAADQKDLLLLHEVDPAVPSCIIGDPVRLNQILVNLISNAVKFTDRGMVKIKMKALEEKEGLVVIRTSVRDTGAGIADDMQQRIFESFTQGRIGEAYGGTGLGLAISRQLVELHGGEIEVDSHLGRGSTFTFDIPFQVGSHAGSNGRDPKASIKGIRVLLVEDNEFNIIVAKDTVETEIQEVDVSVARNGAEAVEMVRKQGYDVILMDINMPVMDGYRAAREIRSISKEVARIPIIAMSAAPDHVERSRCMHSGMSEYIVKPFSSEELVRKISQLLHK